MSRDLRSEAAAALVMHATFDRVQAGHLLQVATPRRRRRSRLQRLAAWLRGLA